jgi:hypothetical protein
MTLSLSVATAKALLKFASSDKNQPHIYGIGITENGLGATDGFAAVEFHMIGARAFKHLAGRTIDRKLFETSTKLCAVTKSMLTISEKDLLPEQKAFPNLGAVTPMASRQQLLPGTDVFSGELRLVPEYLALLALVSAACETDSVSLTNIKIGSPLRFDVTGPGQHAIVLINHL